MSVGAEPCVQNKSGTSLVIGWGNDLRGDDAAGRVIATRVAAWDRAGLRVLSIHQLVPEVAESVAEAERVVFVDTRMDDPEDGVRVRPVSRDGGRTAVGVMGHASGPERILQLAYAAYGARPQAWLVSVPGERFDVGRSLGAATESAAGAAVRVIHDLLEAEPT